MSFDMSRNHRTIAFADLRNCNFYFMDPARRCLNKAYYVYMIIAKEHKKKTIYGEVGTELTVKNLEYPIQKNSLNS